MAKKTADKHIIQHLGNYENTISFQGIKTHNLNDLDIDIPKNNLITIT